MILSAPTENARWTQRRVGNAAAEVPHTSSALDVLTRYVTLLLCGISHALGVRSPLAPPYQKSPRCASIDATFRSS
jgi:hypothetical protein